MWFIIFVLRLSLSLFRIKNGLTPHSVTRYYITGAKGQRLSSVARSDSFPIITIFLQHFSQKGQGTMSQIENN